MITLDDYFKLHGKPESPLLTASATDLLRRVNLLLTDAEEDWIRPGIDQVSKTAVASGYRPPGANAATANAAASSTHLTCKGVDLQDHLSMRTFAVWCVRNAAALVKHGLWMEDPRWTGGRTNTDPWVHLQSRPPKSGRRIYVPSLVLPGDPDFYVRHGLEAP